MKTRLIAICWLLIMQSSFLLSQEKRFFMPYEISRAYEKGTRSYDGKPGPNYWQNFVDYQIHVNIKPAEKLLEGKGKAIYVN